MIKHLLYALVLFLLTGCGQPSRPTDSDGYPERIISLSPNITDTLCDLGLEDRLVGISRFSSRLPESELPIVGDFMNINFETIVGLRPDLVILSRGSDAQKARLESLGIPCLETGSLSIKDVLETVRVIGEACGMPENAQHEIDHFNQKTKELSNTPPHRPRVLITFGEFSGSDEVEQIYAFGAACIHSELLEIAGGENVITNHQPSILLSREAIIRYDPEIIIELTAGGPTNHWESLPSLDAVQHQRIHVLDGDYTCIPAPGSLLRTLADFSTIIRQNDSEAE